MEKFQELDPRKLKIIGMLLKLETDLMDDARWSDQAEMRERAGAMERYATEVRKILNKFNEL